MSGSQVIYVGAGAPGANGSVAALLEAIAPDATLPEPPADADGAITPEVVVLHGVGRDAAEVAADLARLALVWPTAAVVVLTEATDPVFVRTVLDAGAATVLRPDAPAEQARATLLSAIQGTPLVELDVVRPVMDVYAQMHLETERRNRAVIESLAAAVEAKDSVTSRHLRSVSRLAIQLAEEVDRELARDDDFLFGCLLHDVGKIGVPERILMKPGPLTEEEWKVMRRHPETGATVVRPLGLSGTVTDVVLHHHERWDGSGYPHGLAEEEIPLCARIFSVCDALEAMTAARPYRAAMPAQVAYERVCIEAGQQFDPTVIVALRRGVEAGTISIEDETAVTDRPPRRRISSAL